MPFRVSLGELGYVEYDEASPPVRVGDRMFPSEIRSVFPSDKASPALHLRVAWVDGAPTCREVRIVAKESGRGIQSADLRGVRLDDWIEDLVTVTATDVVEQRDGLVTTAYAVSRPEQLREAARAVQAARRGARKKITPKFLREVAQVYREHTGRAPTEAVQLHFGVGYRAAAGYVQKARAAGLLPPTTPGKKKA